jgi:hypothetical protein
VRSGSPRRCSPTAHTSRRAGHSAGAPGAAEPGGICWAEDAGAAEDTADSGPGEPGDAADCGASGCAEDGGSEAGPCDFGGGDAGDSVFGDSVFGDSVFGGSGEGGSEDGGFEDGGADEGGCFDAGEFEDGEFEDGEFEDDEFDDGEFDDGEFDDGEFDDGDVEPLPGLVGVDGPEEAGGHGVVPGEPGLPEAGGQPWSGGGFMGSGSAGGLAGRSSCPVWSPRWRPNQSSCSWSKTTNTLMICAAGATTTTLAGR